MITSLTSIELNDASYAVALLHKALEVLGMPVSDEERAQSRAGEDTRKKVQALRSQLHVDAPRDDKRIVDEATAAALDDALSRAGLTDAKRAFTVAGTVKRRDGSLEPRRRLVAFDLDLRGVGVYRSVETLAELRKSCGCEPLGVATSDSAGQYRLTFYDWQYARAERKKADVVVFAFDDSDERGRILGRSRLAHASDYSDLGVIHDLDVTVYDDSGRTEYEIVMASLRPFLEESGVGLGEIARSPDQLGFTADELDLERERVEIAAAADLLAQRDQRLSHELFYAIGRQSIALDWMVLHGKRDDELRAAIAASIDQRVARDDDEAAIQAFLAALREQAVKAALEDRPGDDGADSLDAMLANALPQGAQRASFVGAVGSFSGADFRDFWTRYLPEQPEFKDRPDLVQSLLLTSQLTALTGNHQALVRELQVERKIQSTEQLLDLGADDWLEIVKKTRAPAGIDGDTDEIKARRYVDHIRATLDAAFPTQRISRMVKARQLPLADHVAGGISEFLAKTPRFDFATSRVLDFDQDLRASAGERAPEVRDELLKMQRVFQVSTSPEAMATLMQGQLHSAYAIAGVPRKTFLQTYSAKLGGEHAAFAIHERASHIAAKSEMAAMHVWEYARARAPHLILGDAEAKAVQSVLQNELPNYATLFGSPDLCECKACNSVYGAAAYFVDLLRFLWRSEPNAAGETPLDVLAARRPDLLHLPLTCENTNTVIPYIDLANEVMEYYAAHGSVATFTGYDTGDTTAEELRANPQNFNLEAYRKLKDARYPFTLPYHQPLGVIRTYSDHLKVSRHDAMRAVTPEPDPVTAQAIAAEALRLSQEEHQAIAGAAFDGTPDATALHAYYGLGAPADLESLSAARELLRRSGLSYPDLVELLKTRFINPYQGTLDFLQQLLSYATIDASTVYARLEQIEAGTLDPASDADLTAALTAYNAARGATVTPAEFGEWVVDHLGEFRQVITLYEPQSRCDLDTTTLRTIESIYEGAATSGISADDWSKIHRFIRLWRKLGWTIHETDLMLAALGERDIAGGTVAKLAPVLALEAATRLPLNQLAVLWGNIDTYGAQSLYKKLFLNKAVQQIDPAFEADAWGDYLGDATAILGDHRSAILAAFRLRDEDLDAIFEVARVIDGGAPRPLDPASDALNLQNLSTIYRHAALAKALKLRTSDLSKLIALLGAAPFSRWDIQLAGFVDIDPRATDEFARLAAAIKEAGFNSTVLQYVLEGTLPADSTLGLDLGQAQRTARDVRAAFSAIEQAHPDEPPSPLSADVLGAKLALTFQPDMVARLLAVLDGSAPFEALTDTNLAVVIPEALAGKYSYVKGSGRLTAAGVMTDAERAALEALPDTSPNFAAAVGALYAAPEALIAANFDGIFTDLTAANAALLDHPAQTPPATLEDKLAYVYARFVPVLKSKLRRGAITEHVAALIGLSEAATAVLIAADVEGLVAALSTEGFSATYYSDPAWTTLAASTADAVVDFDWASAAPRPGVPADGFSARWYAYLVPPASGEYTLVVEVAEADEVFSVSLDDVVILEKAAADSRTSFEVVTALNGAAMHRLRLDYGETSQNAGVRLSWKTATTALEVVPAAAAYPGAILDAFAALATLYHRAAKLILGFGLSEVELGHFIAFAADFGGVDFKALTAASFRRLHDYTTLRKAVPEAQASLTDLFAAASAVSPPATVAELKAMLLRATAWDETNVDFLVDTHFGLTAADFRNEIALHRVRAVIAIAAKTGLSAETIAGWGAAATDFDALHATAQVIKNAVKAKYEAEDWLDLAGNLSDTIREQQQPALVAYLLTRPAIQAWGARDADALFEYFLIDVQMDACMETSRVVQANASVQMFVNRCLLNLESDRAGGSEEGVSPGAVDKDRWEWMKAYRVWEANRKVLLYPENWLEPEWRNDRSELFKELESYLVQNDITDRSVEAAFRGYLAGLNEVANLEVCGLYRERYRDGKLKLLHVFGRTHNAPYQFYYRTWNEYRKWSAWEKVQLDIRCVESGDRSGVHLIPIVWKDRLFLFWPEFLVKQEQPAMTADQSVEDLADDRVSMLAPLEYWEIKLAWSEYVDGKWSPKQVSKELVTEHHAWYLDDESSTRFATEIGPNNELNIYFLIELNVTRDWFERGSFRRADIASKVNIHSGSWVWANRTWDYRYRSSFMSVAAWDKLELLGDTYLRASSDHRLLLSSDKANYAPTFDEPFFFRDPYRTYFVRPIDVPIHWYLRDTILYKPFLPGLIEKSYYRARPPRVVPDDSILGDVVRGSAAIGAAAPRTITATAALARATAATAALPRAATATAAAPALGAATAMSYATDKAAVSRAFGGVAVDKSTTTIVDWARPFITYETGLEFHTFHHPYSSDYVTRLNQGGVSGLLESDTSIASDEGATFESTYDPNFMWGLVQKPADFAARTYYKENVCFDVYGANSLYNWELFLHAPLYIATRLSRNGRYEEAMKWFHYIFDPTTDELPLAGQPEVSRYWKVLPFKATPAASLEDWFRSLGPNGNPDVENAIIGEWRDSPFDPHLIASNRPLAYMKHVVIKYVENLIAWGDSLFRQDTMESVNEALQIYVIANHILGPRPELVPKRGLIKAESYASLESKWDDFSNALVALENLFPYSSEATISDSSTGTSLLGVGSALYFCIPANDKLMAYWDTVADRLYKIRHCQNLDGALRKLALFAPPIDPGALIQAAAQGLSLGSILADLSSPPPIYRFTFLIQRANEFCADVKSLGASLLAALEKKDAEELARLRASHEAQMLALMTAVRARQVLAARANKENFEKARATAALRLRHFTDLLGNDAITIPDPPEVSPTLTVDSSLPADTNTPTIVTDVDQTLADTDEAGVKVIAKEKLELDKLIAARDWQIAAKVSEAAAAIAHIIPTVSADGKPFGVGAGASWGGTQLGNAINAAGKVFDFIGSFAEHEATMAARMAAYIRREQEWTLQANLAAREIVQIDKQITSAAIQIQVAEIELANHERSIEDAKAVEQLLKDKFTTQEMYQWMKEQLFAVYKQAYNLAHDMAKKAEKAYKLETGAELASFIQYGYWDNAKQGLVAGEKLQMALRQLEKSYLEENRRELELTKNISLARLDPLALIELRETGRCYVSLPEELFDLDFRGHYFRRIKSVRLSIPCVAGPHTSIGCSLHLLNNTIRVNTSMSSAGKYEHENDEGAFIDDDRFRASRAPVTAIATSQAQNDAGMFELIFRDERYLPFEGAGAISEWQIELSTDKELRQFDYATITDVILHLGYTAREDRGLFMDKAAAYIKDFLVNAAELSEQPLMQMISMKHEFPTEWYRFLRPSAAGAEQILRFTLGERRFPFFVRGRRVVIDKIDLFARSTRAATYHAVLSYVNHDGDTVTSTQITAPESPSYGGIHKATLRVTDAGLALDEIDIEAEMTLKLKRSDAGDYTVLAITPEDEISDIYLVLSYKLA